MFKPIVVPRYRWGILYICRTFKDFIQEMSADEKNATLTGCDSDKSIEQLLGIAVGCVGMSIDDFERCTPSEFYGIWKVRNENKSMDMRQRWEQTRWMMLTMAQPYSNKPLKLKKVLDFPWDKEQKQDSHTTPKEELSPEERKARFEAAKKRYGLH